MTGSPLALLLLLLAAPVCVAYLISAIAALTVIADRSGSEIERDDGDRENFPIAVGKRSLT